MSESSMRRFLPLILFACALPAAAEHFILRTEHTLRPAERAELEASGIEILQVLPDQKYIVRSANARALDDDPRVVALESIAPAKKIARSAYREAALARPFARIRLVFHDDVSYAEAAAAIARVGGTLDAPLDTQYVLPQRLQARIPFATLTDLAADDRVFAVYGPPLKIGIDNALAAQLSHVTPLYSAPYNLSGAGVVVSEFEFSEVDAAHPDLAGRVNNHLVGGDSGSKNHATHVAGTIISNGASNPNGKGMAPAAVLHVFDTRVDYPIILSTKQNQLPPLSIAADNNSWGFQLGWQFDPDAPNRTLWMGGEDFFGGYDAFYSAPYDKLGRTQGNLFIHSAGNDGDFGNAPLLTGPFFAHGHTDDNGDLIKNETFCYSANGTGTDCTTPCSTGPSHCEITKHPTYGPGTTIGPTGSLKNVISVGAVDRNGGLASFSSRGPTHDGRLKPDLVAKGLSQLSTWPGGGYSTDQGTSMSAPVITGIAAILTEQWRKFFAAQNPLPVALKAVLIAGADDLGLAGPDYSYGFGLANAQASADLIAADANTGSRIRLGTVTQGQQVELPMTVSAAQNIRVVIVWADPEVVIGPDELAERTLVNDLDLKVIDAAGNAFFPYKPDPNNQNFPSPRGVNTVDNVEELEISNAAPGTYRVIVTGTTVATGPNQQYALVANASLGGNVVSCTDSFEPNDSEGSAFGNLVNRTTVSASMCSATDVDYYRIRTTASGPVSLTITTTDTPLRVTLTGTGISPVTIDVAVRATGTLSATVAPGLYVVKVEPSGTVGATNGYTLTPAFSTLSVPRRRSATH
jgi:hypothetical protein